MHISIDIDIKSTMADLPLDILTKSSVTLHLFVNRHIDIQSNADVAINTCTSELLSVVIGVEQVPLLLEVRNDARFGGLSNINVSDTSNVVASST